MGLLHHAGGMEGGLPGVLCSGRRTGLFRCRSPGGGRRGEALTPCPDPRTREGQVLRHPRHSPGTLSGRRISMSYGSLVLGVPGVPYTETRINAGSKWNTLMCSQRCSLGVPFFALNQGGRGREHLFEMSVPGVFSPGVPLKPASMLDCWALEHLEHLFQKTQARRS